MFVSIYLYLFFPNSGTWKGWPILSLPAEWIFHKEVTLSRGMQGSEHYLTRHSGGQVLIPFWFLPQFKDIAGDAMDTVWREESLFWLTSTGVHVRKSLSGCRVRGKWSSPRWSFQNQTQREGRTRWRLLWQLGKVLRTLLQKTQLCLDAETWINEGTWSWRRIRGISLSQFKAHFHFHQQ